MANASRRAFRCGQLLFLAAGLLMLATLASDSKSQGTAQKDKAAPPQVFNDILAKGVEGVDVVALINQEIAKGWKGNKLTPAERCTDYEFIRRASLDLIGRIAKVNEIAEFM